MRRLLQVLQFAREEGLNTRDLVNALQISEDGLRKIETGKTRRPSERTIDGVRRLGFQPGWVRTGRGEMRREPGLVSDQAGTAGSEAKLGGDALSLEAGLLWLIASYLRAGAQERSDILRMVDARLRPPAGDTAHTPDPAAAPLSKAGAAPGRSSTGP